MATVLTPLSGSAALSTSARRASGDLHPAMAESATILVAGSEAVVAASMSGNDSVRCATPRPTSAAR